MHDEALVTQEATGKKMAKILKLHSWEKFGAAFRWHTYA